MSPLGIEMLLHFYSRTNDYRDGDFGAPAVREAIERFRDADRLIEPNEPRQYTGDDRTYRLTERGLAYVQALMSMPLPIAVWRVSPPSIEFGVEACKHDNQWAENLA